MTAAAVLTAVLVLPGLAWGAVDPYCFSLLIVFAAALVFTTKVPVLDENPATPALVAVLLCAAILLPGPAAALVGVLGVVGLLLRGVPVSRVLFGMSCAWLSTIAACLAYRGLGGTYALQAQDFPRSFLPIETAAVILSVVAAVLVALLPFSGGRSSARTALLVGSRLVPRNVAYSFVGLLAAVLWDNGYNAMAALVLLGPLLVTRWATEQHDEQRKAHDATVRTLVQAVEIKDLYTRGHSERVAEASELIARQLRMAPERTAVLRHAAILHDVGKLGVPTRLLRKTGQLDSAEFAAIRLHPTRGVDVVRDIAFLDEAYSAILHHHERMDGNGYPSGLAGSQIPRFARIIAVADAFDSMTSTRSYRGARSVPAALTELRRCAGAQFDPEMVAAMERAMAELAQSGRGWLGDGTVPQSDEAGEPSAGPGTLAEALADRLAGPGGPQERVELDHDDPAFTVLPARDQGQRRDREGSADRADASVRQGQGSVQSQTPEAAAKRPESDHDDPAFTARLARASGRAADRTADHPATRTGDPSERTVTRPGDSTERSAARSADHPAERSADRTPDRPADRSEDPGRSAGSLPPQSRRSSPKP